MRALPLICAVLGAYIFRGFAGALIGYGVGLLLNNMLNRPNISTGNPHTTTQGHPNMGGGYNRNERYTDHASTSRDEFLNSLLLLSAQIIQADGKIMHSEMEHVREFWRQNFGEDSVESANARLLAYFEQRKSMTDTEWKQQIVSSCYRLRQILTSESRSQIISFLCSIAKADGKIDPAEVTELKRVATYLGFDASSIDQLLNMGGNTLEQAYKVLGVSPDATDDEVKRAYRKMALQYHPDKVATLGDDVRAAAEKKFKEIGAAKDLIWAARGL